MRLVSRTLLGVAVAATLIGGGFAVAVAAPTHGSASAGQATCTSIRTTLGGQQGSAGSVYQNIRFTNTGSTACQLAGHPGVAYVNAHKVLVGWPAAPFTTARKGVAPSVVIPPGQSAAATMRIPDYANFSPMDCIHFNAHLIRVSFAGKTTFLPWDQTECTSKYARSYIGQVHA
jgi:Protein of unknown function (DUF4232)